MHIKYILLLVILIVLAASGNCNFDFTREIAWCAAPGNHEIRISEEEKYLGQLDPTTFTAALDCMRRCGLVKLLGAIDYDALKSIRYAIREFLHETPELSPFLVDLRQSDGGGSIDFSQPPWKDGSGRLELNLPFRSPFNSSTLMNSTLVMPVVSNFLGNASSGINFDPSVIFTGPNTPAQQVHNDLPYTFMLQNEGVGMPPDVTNLTSWNQLQRGTVTYGISVQMPFVDVTVMRGPTIFCPVSHIEKVYKIFADSNPFASVRSFAASHLCSVKLYGTNKAGDVLIYDQRIIHWGGDNNTSRTRDLLVLTYQHAWWFNTNIRKLSPVAEEEVVRWNRAKWGPQSRYELASPVVSNFSVHAGRLTTYPILVEFVTLEQAKLRCSTLERCEAFSFHGDPGSDRVKVYYTNVFDVDGIHDWTTYRLSDAHAAYPLKLAWTATWLLAALLALLMKYVVTNRL